MSLYCQFERDQSEQSSRQPAFIGMLIEHGAIRFRHWSREKSKGNHTVGFRIKSHRSTTRRTLRDNTPSKEATPNGSVMATGTGFITRRDAAGLNEAVSTSINAAIDPHEWSERTSMALHYRCLLRAGVGLPGSPDGSALRKSYPTPSAGNRITMRYAAQALLRNAVSHWACVAVLQDPKCRSRYQPVDEVLNWSSTHNIWRTKLRSTALRSRSIAEQRLRQRAAMPPYERAVTPMAVPCGASVIDCSGLPAPCSNGGCCSTPTTARRQRRRSERFLSSTGTDIPSSRPKPQTASPSLGA